MLERNPQAPNAWLGDLPVTSRYTAGIAGEKFFRAMKDEGKILGTFCENCDITYIPGRIFCERCMAELDHWQDVGTIGEIYTFTLLFENLDGTQREEPLAVAFIRMGDGGLIHQLGEVDLEDISIGMPVEAVFKPKSKRQGSILDIQYFRPLTE
ncbi:MAG: hypothetical protein A2Z14_10870 [Chloroflexi bacterium RBG_16_48_8]|nr:MAG: hypothetical protein A2Z14_10870 [Chloroflexi bacterium RBG_16_48_8]